MSLLERNTAGKRSRDDDHATCSSPPPERSTQKSNNNNNNDNDNNDNNNSASSSSFSPPPPQLPQPEQPPQLHDIPSLIQNILQNKTATTIITSNNNYDSNNHNKKLDIGIHCPRCGSKTYIKNGKIKIRGILVQKYNCRDCYRSFRPLTAGDAESNHVRNNSSIINSITVPLLSSPSYSASAAAAASMGANIDNTNVNNVDPIPTTTTATMQYETKQTLQRLFNHASDELVKRTMETDELEFERKMLLLQDQLKEKRRSISRFLGFPLDEDCVVNANIAHTVADAANAAVETVDTSNNNNNNNNTANEESVGVGSGVTNSYSSKEKRSKFPFRDIILLLRRETPKLERAVDGLLLHHTNRNNPREEDDVGVGTTATGRTTMNFLKARQQSMAEEEELESSDVDVVSDYCSSKLSSSSSKLVCGDGRYNLASRIVQEDGEEFEIFEKCNGGDDD